MTNITERLEELTVNEVIRRYPASVEVFNRHGIDACCGGASPVPEAAQRDGADADVVISELRQIVTGTA
jgi:iron-sulfur cluster repair protein YtfE (RIC family)